MSTTTESQPQRAMLSAEAELGIPSQPRAVALTRFEQTTIEDLPEKVRTERRPRVLLAADDDSELVSLDEMERRYILRVLEAAGGNKTSAARILGLDRKTLYRKLERWGAGSGG